jgi:gluconolactonase
MSVQINDAQGAALVGRDSTLERLRSGFNFTEGPVWSAGEGCLIFSDIPGDEMWRWSDADGFSSFRKPSNMANGNTIDHQGRLLSCEHATSRLTRVEPDGTTTVLASHYDGQELNSPNDVVVDRDGAVYFTDPTYGRSAGFGVLRQPALSVRGLYRVTAEGVLELLVSDFDQPNGLCFSLQGDVLYVNDTERMHIRAFAVSEDRKLSGGEVWAETTGDGPGGPDGMKLDGDGNVWSTGPGGLHVFDPEGTILGVLDVPETVGNFAWGDADLKTLYICASTSLYRIRTEVAGYVPWISAEAVSGETV